MRILHTLLSFLLTLALSINVFAKISGELISVEWKHCGEISESQLAAILPIRVGDSIDSTKLVDALDSLVNRLQHQGYPAFRIDTALWTTQRFGGTLRIFCAGTQPLILDSVVSPDSVLNRPDYSRLLGEKFDRLAFRSLTDQWLKRQADSGFALAFVNIDSCRITETDQNVSLVFASTPSRGAIITLSGLTLSDPGVIPLAIWQREARMRFPTQFSTRKLQFAKRYLLATGSFESMSEPQLQQILGATIVHFPGQLRGASRIEGVAGYRPKTARSNAMVTGSAHLTFNRLFKSFRKMDIEWQRPDERNQQFGMLYREPWMFGIPLYGDLSVETKVRDTLFSEQKYRLQIGWQPIPEWEFSIGWMYRELSADSLSVGLLGYESTIGSGGTASAQYDTRDDAFNPHTGLLTFAEWSSLRSVADTRQRYTVSKYQIRVEQSLPIKNNFTVQINGVGSEVKTSLPVIPIPERIPVGGIGTIRGYREVSLYGRRFAALTIEPRWLLSDASRAYLFVDGGFVRSIRTIDEQDELLAAWGAGSLLKMRTGKIGVDIGWSRSDAIMNGKVTFRVIQEF